MQITLQDHKTVHYRSHGTPRIRGRLCYMTCAIGKQMKPLVLCVLGLLLMTNANAGDARDYSHVDSKEKAMALVEKGELFKLLLFPAEFGGEDIPQNVVFVPAGIPEIKDRITGTLIRFVQDGLIDNLKVEPEYKGKSFVPSKINMHTSHSGKASPFNPSIEIW